DLNAGGYELFVYSFATTAAAAASAAGGSTLVGGSGADTLIADSGNVTFRQPTLSGAYAVIGGSGRSVLYKAEGNPSGDTIQGNVTLVSVPTTLPPPGLAPVANQTVNEGSRLDFFAVGTDADPRDTFTYSLAAASAGTY